MPAFGAAQGEMELPMERTPSPQAPRPVACRLRFCEVKPLEVPDADRAAGGTSPRPEPHYGGWAFPGQMPTPKRGSEASTRAEQGHSHGQVTQLSELTASRAPSRGPRTSSERRQEWGPRQASPRA